MGANLINAVIEIGTAGGNSPAERRSIIFSNCIALVLSAASVLLFVIIPQNHNWGGFTEAFYGVLIFSFPILINQLSFTTLSRIYLCWVPPLLITWTMVMTMQGLSLVPSSNYSGLRIYLLSASCIPYLLLDRRNIALFILGILPTLLLIAFNDYILNLLGVGYSLKGIQDVGYNFIHFRSLIAYTIIGGSCLSLRFMIDKSDLLNQKLISELEQKNQLIQKQARHQLQGAFERLNYHVNNTPLAVIERDKDMNITFWNKRAEELFGWEQHEVLGKKAYQFLAVEEDREDARKYVQDMINGDIKSHVQEIRNVSKDGKILFCNWYYSVLKNEDGSVQGLLSVVSDATEQKATNYQLKQRIKELTSLYRAGQILHNKARRADEVLNELVEVIPHGVQYPDFTAARIIVGDTDYKTKNFSDGVKQQKAEFQLPQGLNGAIEIVYIKEIPDETEGVFFAEEHDYINMIAEMLRTYFVRRFESEALLKSQANLNATINNTNVIIWSVDRNMNLLAYNRSFENHLKKRFGLEPMVGSRILMESNDTSLEKPIAKWEILYQRALEGEIVTFEESDAGTDFHCSLCPIIETDGRITGVSIFAEDITEEKLRAKELGEALKKIGELRLMALRSVMNPHFVFNVLNSIQFYIVGNDRLNAVNYLSMFSKLIRSILTHSVNNKIRIEDEIELLKNYVQLERVRFENKFSFTLEIDPKVEMDIEIPSLLVQPYVENAILHGIYNKQGLGSLTIRIKENEDAVVFEIEDDGVGREAAIKIRQRSFADHKSLGVKLTEERLKLINEHHNVSSQIIDLMDGDNPCGTKVIIWVKIY